MMRRGAATWDIILRERGRGTSAQDSNDYSLSGNGTSVLVELSLSEDAFAMELNTTSTPVEPNYSVNIFDRVTEKVANILNVYYTPALILLGCVGNLLSVYVFYKSKVRLQSTSIYLSALAISDTVFLLQLLPPWLNAIQFTNWFHLPGFCEIVVYTSYVSCCLSAWLVVTFTVERFVAVVYPLRRNSMCTVARAKHIMFGLVSGALSLNIPVIKFTKSSSNDCNVDEEYISHAARFNIVDTTLSFTTPLAIIILLNTWIMVAVYRLERARHALVKAEQSASPNTGSSASRVFRGRSQARTLQSYCSTPQRRSRGRPQQESAPARLPQALPRSQKHITRMLLIVSSVFVILNLPAYTLRILAYAYNMRSAAYTGRWAALQQLALLISNTNFGINFILYCLTGQNFRRALRLSMPWLPADRPRRAGAVRRPTRHAPAASSVSTSCTSSTEAPALNTIAPHNVRRHRSEPFINRWMFNSRRVQRALDLLPESPIELQVMAPSISLPDIEGQGEDAVTECLNLCNCISSSE